MRLVLLPPLLGALLLLPGCSDSRPPKHPLLPERQAVCDDGGAGGVVVNGVCL
jgi:hypothetical protein